MSFAADYEAYNEWYNTPKNPEEFDRLQTARMYLENALDLAEEGSRIAEYLERVRGLI